jgi:hypothetical protein
MLLSSAAQAQVTVVSRQPARHAAAAARNAVVAVGFSQPISAATAPNLRVYGSQLQGRRAGNVAGGGTASLTFTPAKAFAPGEAVSVSVPPTLASTAGAAATRQVYQFTAATGGTGRGYFADTTIVGNTGNRDQVLGDIDGDGDLDLITTGSLFGCRIFLNNGAGQYSFKTGVVTAQTPSGVVLGDVDNDGDLDMLVGDADNASLAVCRNDGAGNFSGSVTGAQNATVGNRPVSVAVGDLDGDGDLDFATANAGSNTATVWFNTGGSPYLYTTFTTVAMGSGPTAIVLADVDNDGDLDLVTSNGGTTSNPTGEVHISRNSGTGTFGSYTSVLVGLQPTELQLADIDGDGDLDLLTANTGAASLSVRQNNGSGTFSGTTTLALPAGSTPTGLRVGDVDADGDLDLVVAQGTGGRVFTCLNTAGTFAVQARPLRLNRDLTAPANSVGVTLGDVDGDLDLDVITSDQQGRVMLSLNLNAPPTLPIPTITSLTPASGPVGASIVVAGTNLTDVTSVLFNGLPAPGFVLNGQGTGITVTVPAGATSGVVTVVTDEAGTATSPGPFTIVVPVPVLLTSSTPARNAPSGSRTSITATFSNTITAATAGTMRVHGSQRRGRRTGTITGGGTTTLSFAPAQDFAPGERVSISLPSSLQATDGNRVARQVVQFTAAVGGTGRHDFITSSTLSMPNNFPVQLGDFDNDGDPDLAIPNYVAGVQLYVNNGAGTYTSGATLPGSAQEVATGDIDNDGDLDLLVGSSYVGGYQVWVNNGSGTFASGATVTTGTPTGLTALADVDADGDLDLLSTYNYNLSVFFNDGTGTFGNKQVSSLNVSGTDLAVGDVDNDGDLDLVLCGSYPGGPGGIGVNLNDGTGAFTSMAVPFYYIAYQLALGDVDGDGDLDLAATSQTQALILPNNGSGSFSLSTPLATLPLTSVRLALADTDADGDLDLVTNTGIGLNNGTGAFPQIVTTTDAGGSNPSWLGMTDVDGDGDLDLLASDQYNLLRIKLNRPGPPPALTALTPGSGPVGSSVLLTGLNLGLTTGVAFNGLAATAFTIISATQVVATVPAGATSGPVMLTAAGGTATAATSFTVTQALAVTALSPTRNALGASRTAAVSVTLARPVSAATASELRVFSQRRGRLAGTLAGGGTATLTFTPGQPLLAGEAVSVSIPDRVAGTDGSRAVRQVSQFTAAATGTGTALLLPGAGPSLAGFSSRYGFAAGDVDGDGDLDVVTTEGKLRLNDGAGAFPDSSMAALFPGSYPRNVALADLDSDGDLDMLSSSGHVYFSDGQLTFTQQPQLRGLSDDMRDLALGDLDSDGDLDLVVPNYARDSVYVLLNNGGGSFATRLRVAVGSRPVGISLGDIDGDGDLDFVTANEGTGAAGSSLSIGFNNGIGWFGSVQPLAAGTGLAKAVLGDLDGDGDLDLVTSNGLVRLNSGAGTFTGSQTTPTGLGLALADLDSDGDLDLVLTGTGAASVCRNSGAGQFGLPETVALGTGSQNHDPLLADLDGDGDLDLLTANAANETIRVSLNQRLAPPTLLSFAPASGVVGATIILTGSDFVGTTGVSFNGMPAPGFTVVSATRLEVLVPAGATTGMLQVIKPQGTSTSATAFTVLQSVAVVGLNPTRYATVPRTAAVSVSFAQPMPANTSANLAVFSQRRGGRLAGTRSGAGSSTLTFTPAQPFMPGERLSVSIPPYTNGNQTRVAPQVYQFEAAVGGTGRGVLSGPTSLFASTGFIPVLGDVDGDGDLDLLHIAQNVVQLQRNNGAGVFGSATPVLTYQPGLAATSALTLGDIDGDGDLDLAAAYTRTSPTVLTDIVAIRLNDGTGNFTGTLEVPVGLTPRQLALADLDGDGDLDLYTTGNTSQQVYTSSVRLNNGSGQFSFVRDERPPVVPTQFYATPVLGDVDGDGDLDVLMGSTTGFALRLNDGLGHFPQWVVPFPPYYNYTSMSLNDVDGDGDLDAVLISVSLGVIVHLNDGQGNFTSSIDSGGSGWLFSHGGLDLMAVGDLDADGDPDLLLLTSQLSKGLVMTNNGQGSFTPAQQLAFAYPTKPLWPILGDLDGDGDLDLVHATANNYMNTWLNGPGQALGTTAATPGVPGATVYPNPARGQLVVAVPAELRPAATAAPTPLRLYNSVGQLVLEQPLQLTAAGEVKVSVAQLPAGIYTLHLVLRNGVSTHRVAVY